MKVVLGTLLGPISIQGTPMVLSDISAAARDENEMISQPVLRRSHYVWLRAGNHPYWLRMVIINSNARASLSITPYMYRIFRIRPNDPAHESCTSMSAPASRVNTSRQL